jgi:hypothetical protein
MNPVLHIKVLAGNKANLTDRAVAVDIKRMHIIPIVNAPNATVLLNFDGIDTMGADFANALFIDLRHFFNGKVKMLNMTVMVKKAIVDAIKTADALALAGVDA